MKALFSNFFPALHRFFSIRGISIFTATAALVVGFPYPAMADATYLGDLLCNTYGEFDPFITLIDALAYVAGGILLGQGLYLLKMHADNPQNHPLHHAIARMLGGAALLTAPSIAATILNTMLLGTGPGGAAVCGEVDPTVIGGGVGGLDILVTNFVNNIQWPLFVFISAVAYVMGIIFIVRGLIKGAKYGTDPRTASVPHILTYLIIGAILIAVGENCAQIMQTIFGYDTFVLNDVGEVMGWTAVAALDTTGTFATVISAALTFFQLIGMIAFVRGWYIVKNAIEGAGQATVAQGFTHIIGGVLAINIYKFLEIMDNTFGTGLLG